MTREEKLALDLFARFNRSAGDLYPGRYTRAYCLEIAEKVTEVRALAAEKGSLILAHYYQHPEIKAAADFVGDSLALALYARNNPTPRIDFSSVHFMNNRQIQIAIDRKGKGAGEPNGIKEKEGCGKDTAGNQMS